MLGVRRARLWRLIDRGQADLPHQTPRPLAADAPAQPAQVPRHLAGAIPRRLEERLVDEPHELKVLFALARRLAVERRPRDRYELALSDNGEPLVTGIDHRLPPIQAQRSKALAKKSRSTTSWPILAWSFVTSASRVCSRALAFSSNTLASFSIASRFQAAIWVGCSSCLVASSATVWWPLIASSATLESGADASPPK